MFFIYFQSANHTYVKYSVNTETLSMRTVANYVSAKVSLEKLKNK